MAEPKVDMRDALLTFIGPVAIKGMGAAELKVVEGATEKMHLWLTNGTPRLLLEIESKNFVNIGESLFSVRYGSGIIEIERRKI